MRKILSLLTAVLLVGSVWGTDPSVTLDFTSGGVAGENTWGFPVASYVTTAASYTKGTYTISFGASSNGHKAMFQPVKNSTDTIWKGLIMGKENATLTLPTMSFNVNKIIVRGIAGASSKVTFNIFVGSSAVSTEATSSVDDHEFAIASASQAAGTVYVIKVTNANNCQISAVEFYEAPTCNSEVNITKGMESNGTFTLSDTKVCADGDGGEITVSNIVPADGYRFKEITTSASGTVNNSTKKVTGIKAATTITAIFEEILPVTVSFSTGAGNPTVSSKTEASVGAGITLPAGPTPACSEDGWSFAGWATAAVAEQTATAPTLLLPEAKYTPAENVTLYAVYAKESGSAESEKTYTLTGNWTTDNGNWTKVAGSDLNSGLASGKYGLNSGSSTAVSPVSYSDISKVIFTGSKSGSGGGSVEFLYGSGDSWTTLGSKTLANTLTWSLDAKVSGQLKCVFTRTAGNIYIASIKVTALFPTNVYLSAPTCSPTDIEETVVENAERAVKTIVNGQLFILRDGKTYTITGQLVK